jgi:hypothetical protein
MANDDQKNNKVDQAAVDAVLVEVDFPATRDDLVAAAQDTAADQTIVILFQDLPDEDYATRGDVNKAISEQRTGDQTQS